MADNEVTLRDYLDERFTHLESSIQVAYITHQQLHSLEHEAISRATEQLERRLGEMHEFRNQLSVERQGFITRTVYDAQHEALSLRLEAMLHAAEARISTLERIQSRAQGSLWAIGVIWTLITVALGWGMRFLK